MKNIKYMLRMSITAAIFGVVLVGQAFGEDAVKKIRFEYEVKGVSDAVAAKAIEKEFVMSELGDGYFKVERVVNGERKQISFRLNKINAFDDKSIIGSRLHNVNKGLVETIINPEGVTSDILTYDLVVTGISSGNEAVVKLSIYVENK